MDDRIWRVLISHKRCFQSSYPLDTVFLEKYPTASGRRYFFRVRWTPKTRFGILNAFYEFVDYIEQTDLCDLRTGRRYVMSRTPGMVHPVKAQATGRAPQQI